MSTDWSSRTSPSLRRRSAGTRSPNRMWMTSPGNQLLSPDRLPPALAQHARVHRQALLEQRERPIGTRLLHVAQHRIEYEQCTDHDRLLRLAERELQDDRRLQHPRHGRPELGREDAPRMLLRLGYGVRTVALEQPLRLLGAQAGVLSFRGEHGSNDAAKRTTRHATPGNGGPVVNCASSPPVRGPERLPSGCGAETWHRSIPLRAWCVQHGGR